MSFYCPRHSEGLTEQKLGDEILIYTSQSESVHVLNKTAGFIWRLCDGRHTVEAIEEELHRTFEMKPGNDAANDIRRLLENFATRKLIQPNA